MSVHMTASRASLGSIAWIFPARPESARYWSNSSVVIQKPGGTGRPAAVISARRAALPPSNAVLDLGAVPGSDASAIVTMRRGFRALRAVRVAAGAALTLVREGMVALLPARTAGRGGWCRRRRGT